MVSQATRANSHGPLSNGITSENLQAPLSLTPMSDILDPSILLSSLPNVLPPSCTLLSPQDAIVSLIHSCMNALSFRLVGIDEANSITASENVLPEDWNKHSPENYILRYKHEQSSMGYILKIGKLGSQTVINAIATESDKVATFDIKTQDYTSQSFFPYKLSEQSRSSLVHGYISSNRVADFVQVFKLKVLQKIIPGLNKSGDTESVEESSAQPRIQQIRPPSPPHLPPYPERFPRQPSSSLNNPLAIGRADLDPIPGHPFAPSPLFGGTGDDGMVVGRNHPIFSNRFVPGRSQGPWGGDGFLPPMGAPPGARFDPVAPLNQIPERGGIHPRTGVYRSGEPDNDEFQPPGMNDIFS